MPQIMNYDPADKTATPLDRALRSPGILLTAFAVIGVLAVALLVVFWILFADTIKPVLASQFGFSVVLMVVLVGLILLSTAVCILAERKIASFIQDRKGPNRAGFWGVLQPVADGLKFFLKEDIIPAQVDRPLYLLAPCVAFGLALLGFAIIPWAGEIHWPWMPAGETVTTQVASLDIGILYILAVGSLAVYGVVLAGYASNNKYSFYGGVRATAQMLSYEVPLGLGLLVVLLVVGSLRPEVIVNQQAESGVWNVFLHPIACLLVIISAFAENNRAPFDLPEAEQELVGGYHTEYSSMKFAMFFLAEYAHMVTNSALIVAVFFGGWHLWFLPNVDNTAWWAALLKFGVFWGKVACFIGLYMWVRWTLPRFRFDQLMRLTWKSLVPIGMALVIVAGVLVACGWQRNFFVSIAVNIVLLAVGLWLASRSKQPITGRQISLPDIEVRPVQPV
ncbi:MAG TPA: NADH-quinone oxidoreductase subunit NuoH [Phycisphaerae bacterium]|nr:NADH-quinone oxidoreductase subunit NuoH [Phycisphaerae bacterium]